MKKIDNKQRAEMFFDNLYNKKKKYSPKSYVFIILFFCVLVYFLNFMEMPKNVFKQSYFLGYLRSAVCFDSRCIVTFDSFGSSELLGNSIKFSIDDIDIVMNKNNGSIIHDFCTLKDGEYEDCYLN